MSALDRSLQERVTRLEATTEAVLKGIDEIKLGMRELRTEMNARFEAMQQEIRGVNLRLDSWLKWVLGFIFSSWLTLMASIWLKR